VLAREALASGGVIFVTLDHLPGTFLDGAAMCRDDGVPIIALTLRYDRLDNFWFTLLHEYAHVCHHLNGNTTVILDDLEVRSSVDIESEADAFAQAALIPPMLWARVTSPDLNPGDVIRIAADAEVHPAIVAGRWQREYGDYRRFSKMLGRGEVRAQLTPTKG
jgi:HTH-type transcriptional regulator / antitoxin HigA